MNLSNSIADIAPVLIAPRLRAIEVITSRLTDADKTEVLDFLARRPMHTVAMVGFINDNGLVSPLNRGTFYGCRNYEGQLEGVALIGHAMLMETSNDQAIQAFAQTAQHCPEIQLIMFEENHIDKHPFKVPFVCGCRDLGEATRRIAEGAAMIRTKGEAGTGNVVEAVRHARAVNAGIRKLQGMNRAVCAFVPAAEVSEIVLFGLTVIVPFAVIVPQPPVKVTV